MSTSGTQSASPQFFSRGRWWLLGFLLAGAVLFTALAGARGYQQAWHAWGIVSADTPFLDLQVITAGAESHALGVDPLYDNPCDPLERRMNYPRAWQGLFVLGITQQHTVPLGIAIVVAFFIGVFVFARRLDLFSAAGVAVAVCSPAVMLCLERGNIDLVLFAVTTLALLALSRSPVAATGLLLGGFALKLYPILGLVALLREKRRRFLVLTLSATVVVAVYIVRYRADLIAIGEATPSQTWLSFGLITAARALAENLSDETLPWLTGARLLGTGALLVLLGVVVWRLRQWQRTIDLTEAASPNLDAFRLGAGIYAGTFILGSSFDYRLVFLLFTLPQLCDWAREADRDRRWVSVATVAAITIALWSQLWTSVFTLNADTEWWSKGVPMLLEQTAKCVVFAGCTYLLTASAPAWVGEWFVLGIARARWLLRTKKAWLVVGLLMVAGFAVQTARVFQVWDEEQPRASSLGRLRAALVAQAVFSGDQVRAETLRAGEPTLHLNARATGTVARLTDLSLEQAARLVFLGCGMLTLAAGGWLSRRLTFPLPACGLVFAAVIWCPALDARATPAEALVVVGAAWAAVLIADGWAAMGRARRRAWAGAVVVVTIVLSEILAVGVVALGWLVLSLLLGCASAWLLGTRGPRAAIWPMACLLPLLPAIIIAWQPGPPVHVADSASRGLIEALRELTPRESVCVIVGDDALQFGLIGADRRTHFWDVTGGTDLERQLTELEQVLVGALIVGKGATLAPDQFTAMCRRLNLDDAPTFAHPTAEVFFSRFLRESAVARLGKEPAFPAVTTTAQSEGIEWPDTPRVVPPGAAGYAFPMISPRPVLYNLAFGYVLWTVNGLPVLRANTDSEVFVPVPPGATSIRWEFGLIAGAYQNETGTDGVEFLIEGESPEGGRREIFRRVLDPVYQESDRDAQTAAIAYTPRPGERLIFQANSNGSRIYDWSYWRNIRVE